MCTLRMFVDIFSLGAAHVLIHNAVDPHCITYFIGYTCIMTLCIVKVEKLDLYGL